MRTLANSFAAGRIHQAYILTGVRGVGKTTTARILARAFNYSVPGKIDEPSIDMPELGVHCQAIMESRHVDVIEMDAASHTGIDDVREIIENARYRPVSARTKVYIIDEVHMLSKQAFNGLLKTLEEPPEHVKFLFATTEIDKVPVTVRSRCIRFDLRRIEAGPMVGHLQKICAAEAVAAEPEALALIARVAEGSVRDALSLLDQGIAHGGSAGVAAQAVRDMLGLSDRGEIIALFERVMKGEIAEALDLARALHHAGADAADILIELAEFCHFVTRAKIAPAATEDPAISEVERERGREFADKLTLGVLTRAWQILLKGVEDVRDSPRPLASAEMALIRLAYASDLPAPEEALRRLSQPTDSPRHAPPLLPRSAEARARRCGLPRRSPPRRSPRVRPRRRLGGLGSRLSRTPSRSRAPSATFSSSIRSNGRCGSRASNRAASPSPRSKAPHPDWRRRSPDDFRNGLASAGWWRWSRDRPRRRCARPRTRAKPSERAARRRIRWCARCLTDSRAPASSTSGVPRPRRHRRRVKPTRRSATPIPASTPLMTAEKEIDAMDIMGMMKKAQAVQAKLQEAQEELGRLEVEGQAGGGMVSLTLNAKGELKGVRIDASLLTPADKEMLEDLIVAAFTDGKSKADRAAAEKMQSLTAGLPLPPGMKLPF